MLNTWSEFYYDNLDTGVSIGIISATYHNCEAV